MARSLLGRIGDDTLAKLEAAATRRHAEARRLAPHEPLGAVYLYGYTIEERLKAAYYRMVGVPRNWNLNRVLPATGATQSPRKIAESQVAALLASASANPVGHNLVGWATLVAHTRRTHVVLAAFAPSFETALLQHAQAAARQWREVLRYRANRPYHSELAEVTAAANWVRRNYRLLWS